MCDKHVDQCFSRALHRLPSHSSVFTFCFPSFNFFSMTVFKREIISQSVLTWLKTIIVFLRNIRNAVSILAVLQAGNFLYVQHGFKFSSWLMVSSLIWYFAHLRSTTKFASMLHADWKQGFFFFLATCATSFRIMTPCFTMWVNKYSAKDSVYLVFARS